MFEKYFHPYSFYKNEIKHEFLLTNISVCLGKIFLIAGLKHGNKVKNKVEIPEWIFSDK